jgi:YggT family protein
MTTLFDVALLVIQIARWFIVAHFIMSWLIQFQVLNIRQPLVAQIWGGLNALLEPIYARVRRFLPQLNGIDLAPIVVLIAIFAVESALYNNQGFFR